MRIQQSGRLTELLREPGADTGEEAKEASAGQKYSPDAQCAPGLQQASQTVTRS